jgi:hypothetical protein
MLWTLNGRGMSHTRVKNNLRVESNLRERWDKETYERLKEKYGN